MKSLQKEQNSTIYYYDPQSAGINLQSSQSDSTPCTLTLFPGPSEEEYTKKEVKITLQDYIVRRQKINTQEWVNSNDQKSWTTNLRQPNKILRL